MNKTHMAYFEKDDVLHFAISDEPEAGSIEISPNITAEINARGELIGIEIIGASIFVRDSVLESVQARMLNLGTRARISPAPKRRNARCRSGATSVTMHKRVARP